MWAGTWRVGGVLAVSRAFGDKLLKQYVVADPEIKEEVVDSSLEFLILASDGLWDVVTNDVWKILLKIFCLDFGYSALGLCLSDVMYFPGSCCHGEAYSGPPGSSRQASPRSFQKGKFRQHHSCHCPLPRWNDLW